MSIFDAKLVESKINSKFCDEKKWDMLFCNLLFMCKIKVDTKLFLGQAIFILKIIVENEVFWAEENEKAWIE